MAITGDSVRDFVRAQLAQLDTNAAVRAYADRLLSSRARWVNAASVAGTTAITETPFDYVPYAATVERIVWVPGAAVTANGTNFFTLLVQKRVAADAYAAATTLAQRSLAATNAVAFTPESLTLAVSSLAAGDILTVSVTKSGGSGLAFPISGLLVEFGDT